MDVISPDFAFPSINCIYFIIFIINRYVLYLIIHIHMYEHIYIDMDAHMY